MIDFIISNRWFNAYGKDANYAWYPEKIINENILYVNDYKTNIELNKENFGTICMPTGTGKSSVIYDDIVRRIKYAVSTNTRTIINISSPQLKLNQQLTLDMWFVLFELFENKTSPLYNNFSSLCNFYFNSSESNMVAYKILAANKYDSNNVITNNICIGEISSTNFIEFDNFVNSDKLISIVCSCHPSLDKFINYIGKKQLKEKGFEIITYIDESHTISDRDFSIDDAVKVDIVRLCENSSAVYAISATPDIKLTNTINKFSKYHKDLTPIQDPYFIHKYPADAISEGIIVAPYIDIWKSSAVEINKDTVCEIYEDSNVKNPTVKYQKILVNCPTGNKADEKKIKTIFDELSEYYKDKIKNNELRIYATSCETGYLSTTGETYNSMKDFTSSIDSAKCDCIVLHIKQMIAGIDISSITQTIMYINDVNENNLKVIIQTCGRCLRSAKGERKMDIELRTKKFGLCSFIIKDDDNETEEKLREFFVRYYMCDDIKFNKQYSYNGSSTNKLGQTPKNTARKRFVLTNQPFIINIKQYIESHKKQYKRVLEDNGNDSDKLIIDLLIEHFNKDNTSMLFDNRMMLKLTREYLANIVNIN